MIIVEAGNGEEALPVKPAVRPRFSVSGFPESRGRLLQTALSRTTDTIGKTSLKVNHSTYSAYSPYSPIRWRLALRRNNMFRGLWVSKQNVLNGLVWVMSSNKEIVKGFLNTSVE